MHFRGNKAFQNFTCTGWVRSVPQASTIAFMFEIAELLGVAWITNESNGIEIKKSELPRFYVRAKEAANHV